MRKILIGLLFSVALVSLSTASFAKGGSVKIYEDKGLAGRVFKVRVGTNISDFKYGTASFNDKCSSVKYNIPSGWTAVLYTDSGYKGREYPMSGSSSAADMGTFEDKCSSIQWIKAR